MSVAQFEDLCDAGKVSANLECFVLEMNVQDREQFRQSQPEQYAQSVRDLQRLGFDVRSFMRAGNDRHDLEPVGVGA
jgi:hypothetical protein